jgi:hypothetical protein
MREIPIEQAHVKVDDPTVAVALQNPSVIGPETGAAICHPTAETVEKVNRVVGEAKLESGAD